jgi:hypothetical protein
MGQTEESLRSKGTLTWEFRGGGDMVSGEESAHPKPWAHESPTCILNRIMAE